MATKTQHPAPFSRFSRIGFGLSPKSNPTTTRPRKNKQGEAEEEWYIPYNGPYEPPPEAPRKQRDSWGDVVLEQPLDDTTPPTDRRKRHGVQYDIQADDVTRKNGNPVRDDDKKKGVRSRSQSIVSGRTVSSGTAVNSQASTTQQTQRSTVSSTHRSAYINLDASGGVGESPIPNNHVSNESSSMHRSNLFAFGGQARKAPLENISRKLSRPPRSSSGLGIGYTAGPNPAKHRRNASTGSSSSRDAQPLQPRLGNTASQEPRRSNDEDYYHSYYSTLIGTPGPAQSHRHPPPSPAKGEFAIPTSRSSHPYARAPVKPEINAQPDLPRLTFTEAPLPVPLQTSTSADGALSSTSNPFIGLKKLKNSISSPDLRVANNLPLGRTRRLPSKRNGLERWLSPETWCDALLFPRPRLRVRQESELGPGWSGRTVSPPGSPITRNVVGAGIESLGGGKGVASRVLAHSRSLAELPKASMSEAGPSSIPYTVTPSVQDSLFPPQPPSSIPRPPRPRSFARDDMSLVPSLAR